MSAVLLSPLSRLFGHISSFFVLVLVLFFPPWSCFPYYMPSRQPFQSPVRLPKIYEPAHSKLQKKGPISTWFSAFTVRFAATLSSLFIATQFVRPIQSAKHKHLNPLLMCRSMFGVWSVILHCWAGPSFYVCGTNQRKKFPSFGAKEVTVAL
jgi:hypothetical protein